MTSVADCREMGRLFNRDGVAIDGPIGVDAGALATGGGKNAFAGERRCSGGEELW